MQDIALLEKQRCNLILTNKAKEAVEECSANEHAFFCVTKKHLPSILKNERRKPRVKRFCRFILMHSKMKS